MHLEALVAHSAISEVWRARSATGQVLALKRFVTSAVAASQAHWLLEREALLLSRLAHPAIVGTHGVVMPGNVIEPNGARSDRSGLALEYLGGGDLVALAGCQPRDWVAAARDVLDAVAHLHSAGFVHGDVKARNAVLASDGRAKLIDFSSCLPRGAVCRTPLGTASQQRVRHAGHVVCEDDDVFACAALVFEMLGGYPPFASERARRALEPVALPAPLADVDRSIDALVEIVCGMLRSASLLGSAELAALATALELVAQQSARS